MRSLPSSPSRPTNASDLVRLQKEATIARQEAAECAEAYAQARDENTDLIAQLTDSNAAYDRMAEQLERTAQDLQSLLSGAVSVAVADAQKRASTAEQEVAALRVELRNFQAVRSRSQSPQRQLRARSRANSPGSSAISPGSSGSPLGLQNAETVKHMQQELLNTVKDTSQLQQCIRRQAQDITALQHALMEERGKAKTALSMCNTAHCNHVRSLVARIESTVAPVSRLAASLQRASKCSSPVPDVLRADARLKSVLESREWTMGDWDAVEDAAICWLDGLQMTVSACADNLECSVLDSAMLQAQADSLLERLRRAEASATAARDGEAAATARESRAQEEAAAASVTVRALRAAMDGGRRTHADNGASVRQLDGRVAVAEQRAAAAEAAQEDAEARAAEMQADLARLQAVCDEALRPTSVVAMPEQPVEQPVGDSAVGVAAVEVADLQSHVCAAEAAQAEGVLVVAHDLVLASGGDGVRGGVDSLVVGCETGRREESSMETSVNALEPGASESGQVPCGASDGQHGAKSTVPGTLPEQPKSGDDRSRPELQQPHSSPTGPVLQLDDRATQALVLQAQRGTDGGGQAEGTGMAAVVMARESLGTAVSAAHAAWTQAAKAVDEPVVDVDYQPRRQPARPYGVQEHSGGMWHAVEDAFTQMRFADDELGRTIEQLRALQQAKQRGGGQTSTGDCLACQPVLQKLEEDRREALQRLSAAQIDLAVPQEQVCDVQAAAEAGADGGMDEQLEAVQAEVAAAREECCSLRGAAAHVQAALQSARSVADATEEQLVAVQRTAESAAERALAMEQVAVQLREEVAKMAEAAHQAGLREATAVTESECALRKARGAEERCATAESQDAAAQAQAAVYIGRCAELQRACLLAELRADDGEAALRQVEAGHRDALRAQQVAAEKITELQNGSLRAAVDASRRASKAAAVIADAKQRWLAGYAVSGGGGVPEEAGGAGAGAESVTAAQQLLLPALQEQMRGLRAAVDEWLQRLAAVEAGYGSASPGGSPAAVRPDAGISSSTASRIRPGVVGAADGLGVSPVEPKNTSSDVVAPADALGPVVVQPNVGEEQETRSQSTLDVLLSSVKDLSMLETALQQPDVARSVKADSQTGSTQPQALASEAADYHAEVSVSSRGISETRDRSDSGTRAASPGRPQSSSGPESAACSPSPDNEAAWREITARHSAYGVGEDEREPQGPVAAEQGLRRALSRIEAVMGVGTDEGSDCSAAAAAEALEDLQFHVVHVERFRALAEEVIVRAKERILAHAREQELDVPVTVTERGSVAVEDVATMLDRVLINSSNNADSLADVREAARTAEADTVSLRAELAEHRAQASVDAERRAGQLDSLRQQVQGATEAQHHAEAEVAALREKLSAAEVRWTAAAAEAATARTQAAEDVRELRTRAADAEAQLVQLELAEKDGSVATEGTREVARGEVEELLSRLAAAEEALVAQHDTARVALDAVVQEREDMSVKLGRMKGALEVAEQEGATTAAELGTMRSALEAAGQERNGVAEELDVVRGALEAAKQDRAATAMQLNSVRSAREVAEQERNDAAAELDTVRSALETAGQERNAVAAELDVVGGTLEAAKEDRAATAMELDSVRSALEAAKQGRAAAAAELDTVKIALETARQERSDAATELDTVRSTLETAKQQQSHAAAELVVVKDALEDSKRLYAELESKHQGAEQQRMEAAGAAKAAEAAVKLELDERRAALRSEQSSKEVLRSALIALQERMAASSESSHTEMAKLQQDLAAAQADVQGLRAEAATRALEAAPAAETASAAEDAERAQQGEMVQLRQAATMAQQREEDLLQQIQQLEDTVQDLSTAMVELQQEGEARQSVEIQQHSAIVGSQLSSLQTQLEKAQEAVTSSQTQLEAAAAREAELQDAAVQSGRELAGASAQIEQLQAQVKELEQDCKVLQSTVEDLQEACEVQAAARIDAEEKGKSQADLALQAVHSQLDEELQTAAKRTAEEHQRLRTEASGAREQLRSMTVASAADADKIAALQATLLFQEHKYKKIMAVHARISRAAQHGREEKSQAASSAADILQSPSSSPKIEAFMHSAPQSPEQSVYSAHSQDLREHGDTRLHELARRAADAEAELEFVRREHENERAIVQELLGDAGTLQAQLDALQANPAIESEKLADEVQQLQEAVSIANNDLQVAEAHAADMQERLEQKDKERADLQALLQQQLTSLLGAQTVLEEQFEEMREERDQALADLQLLADQCSELLSEQSRIFMQAPSDSEQVKWLRNKNLGLQRQLAEVLKDVDVLERRLITLNKGPSALKGTIGGVLADKRREASQEAQALSDITSDRGE